MGRTIASEVAGKVRTKKDLEKAVETHLLHTFYPPFPAALVGPCVKAIWYANRDEWDKKVLLPKGMSYKGKRLAPILAVMEAHRLEFFLDPDGDDLLDGDDWLDEDEEQSIQR